MSRWTECQDVEEELLEGKIIIGKTLALWERVTFSVSVFISTDGLSVSPHTVPVLQDLRGEREKGAKLQQALPPGIQEKKQQDCDRRGQWCKSHDWL